MNSFSETLHQVRIERGFTQEKLAQELSVSRQTISHWENGRAYPDIKTIKLLSRVLDYNFLAESEEEPGAAAGAPAAEAPAEEAPAAAPVRAGIGRKALIAVLVVVALIVVSFIVGFMLTRSNSDTAAQTSAPENTQGDVNELYSYAWFNQTREPVEGQAYVEIVPREDPVFASQEDYWIYCFDFNFSGDAAFTMDRIVFQNFYRGSGNHDVFTFDKETFVSIYGTDTYMPGESFDWQGGFPVQQFDCVCIAIEGTDANGNELIFFGKVGLNPEQK